MKVALIIAGIIGLYLTLARLFILKLRWSDSKAKRIFQEHGVTLQTFDEKIGDRNIHYVVAGADTVPTLIFIHGTPGSWFRFEKLMKDRDLLLKFRMVAIDRPGFGYSDFGSVLPVQDQCELILPVIKKLKTDQPLFICGHSYGGAVVAQLLANAPGLFDKLIIISGALDPAQEERENWGLHKEIIAQFMPGAYKSFYKELRFFKDDLLKLAKDLPGIKEPVLFIHGSADKNVPISNVDYGKKMMQNAASQEVVIIRRAKHQLMLTHNLELKAIMMGLY